MSYDDEIDKDRLYFTQCNDTIFLRCPVCPGEKKVLRHCKLYKNFQSLWCHVRRNHNDLLPGELEEIIQILTGLFKAFQRQMFPIWAYSEAKTETTTTSSILFDGRPLRNDRQQKLAKIANMLKIQSELFPFFGVKNIEALIEKAIGRHDYRTMKFYFECVVSRSTHDKINGVFDVTKFCDLLGGLGRD